MKHTPNHSKKTQQDLRSHNKGSQKEAKIHGELIKTPLNKGGSCEMKQDGKTKKENKCSNHDNSQKKNLYAGPSDKKNPRL